MSQQDDQADANVPLPKPKIHWLRRVVRWIGFAILFYIAVIVIGLIPVNNGFRPAPDGVEIFVFSGPVHSDIIVPVSNDVIDWREHFVADDFEANVDRRTHLAIGWGDRGFFLETPTWNDLRASTAANAMFLPSKTVMHVQYLFTPKENNECKAVKISAESYRELVDFIQQSFDEENGAKQKIDSSFSYGSNDAFYEARGSYHLFNTCNCWVGRGLRTSHIRAPIFTPLPRTVLMYLP